MTILRRLRIGLVVSLLAFVTVALSVQPALAISGSDFRADRIIDDSIFYDSNAMSATDIQAFLNSKVPNCQNAPCLKDYQTDQDFFAPDTYCGGVNAARKSAASIIKDVAVACGMSPKALIVLLEKEQGIVSSNAPSGYQYMYATGFCVPDGPPPPACAGTYGFANQVYYAARQFQKYAKQPNNYTFRAGQVNTINWSPNGACGTSDVFIQNKATAGLYNYTPYRPNQAALNNLYGLGDSCSAYGNRNFWRLFSDWFGSPLTSRCNYDAAVPAVTDVAFRKYKRNLDSGAFVIYRGTSTNCVEAHTWDSGFGSWQNHTASNQSMIQPADGSVQYADLNGDGIDEPILVTTQNTGSGFVEFHVWNDNMQSWQAHAVSNLPVAASTNVAIGFGDMDGDGIDEPIAFGYKNTSSGFVELHYWSRGLQSWSNHVITNLSAPLDPLKTQIGFADTNGDGRDEAIVLGVGGTSTGKLEFHVWVPGQWGWQTHIVSNQDTVDPSKCSVQFGDLDGDRIDNAVLVCKQGTATGRIEFHVWNPGMGTWQGHYVSNQGII